MSKVLIVDDERSIRHTLRDILEFEKYEVDEACDGMEALVKIKQNPYDVIILDIKMPKMDGMDALDRIQEIARETPVAVSYTHLDVYKRQVLQQRRLRPGRAAHRSRVRPAV